jgi:hypothetical protein
MRVVVMARMAAAATRWSAEEAGGVRSARRSSGFMGSGSEVPEDGLAEVVGEPCEAAFDGAFGGSGCGGDGGEGTAVGVAVVEEGAVGIREVGEGELEGGLPDGFGVFWRCGVWR